MTPPPDHPARSPPWAARAAACSTDWIVDRGAARGLPVQSDVDPRRGAAHRRHDLLHRDFPGDRAPISRARGRCSRSIPASGDVDIMLATELLEAGARGRARLRHARSHAADRLDPPRLRDRREDGAGRRPVRRRQAGRGGADSARGARCSTICDRSPSVIAASLNAVLLGVLAATGALPMPRAAFEEAIRDGGIAVDANLHGFTVGFGHRFPDAPPQRAAGRRLQAAGAAEVPRTSSGWRRRSFRRSPRTWCARACGGWWRIRGRATRRAFSSGWRRCGGRESAAGGDGRLTRETARELAVRMSYEDVIRVAQLKSAPGRFARIRAEARAHRREPVVVVDYLKPGIDELGLDPAAVPRPAAAGARDPPRLARPAASRHAGEGEQHHRVSAAAAARRLARLATLHLALAGGAACDRSVARRHPRGLRDRSALAHEIVACARLIKGYGDTYRRGAQNFDRIRTALIAPALDGRFRRHAQPMRSPARAWPPRSDPEGDRLSRVLADVAAQVPAPAALR